MSSRHRAVFSVSGGLLLAALIVAGVLGIHTQEVEATDPPRPFAPHLDVAFVIDESGSMGDDISAVQNNVNSIANQLEAAGLNWRLGLVGFGANSTHGNNHIHTSMTNDLPTFQAAANSLIASGSFEPGFNAASLAASDKMGWREQSGKCIVQITDEDADGGGKAQAIADLKARGATWFGVVNQGQFAGSTANDYGPNTGSLSAETGGQVFSISDFRNDPKPVFDTLLNNCLQSVTFPVPVDIKPTSCPNPINCKGGGVLPVAINGSQGLDVSTIDPKSIRLEGVAPLRWSIEDSSTPFTDPVTGKKFCDEDCTTEGPDGIPDLVLHFDKHQVVAALGLSPKADRSCIVAQLTGEATIGKFTVNVEGEDVLRVLCEDPTQPRPKR